MGCSSCCLLLLFPAGVDKLVLPNRDLQIASNVKVERLHSTYKHIKSSPNQRDQEP